MNDPNFYGFLVSVLSLLVVVLIAFIAINYLSFERRVRKIKSDVEVKLKIFIRKELRESYDQRFYYNLINSIHDLIMLSNYGNNLNNRLLFHSWKIKLLKKLDEEEVIKKVIIDTEMASFMSDLTSSYYLYREEAKLIDNEYIEKVLVDIEQLNLPNFDKIKAEIEEFNQKLDELKNQN